MSASRWIPRRQTGFSPGTIIFILDIHVDTTPNPLFFRHHDTEAEVHDNSPVVVHLVVSCPLALRRKAGKSIANSITGTFSRQTLHAEAGD